MLDKYEACKISSRKPNKTEYAWNDQNRLSVVATKKIIGHQAK